MNKKELVSALAKGAEITAVAAEAVLDCLTETVRAEVLAGNQIQLVGLGIFKPVERKARSGWNPAKNVAIKIPARKSVKFAISSSLKKEVRDAGKPKKAEKKVEKKPAKKAKK